MNQVINKHGLTFNIGETIIRGSKPYEVRSTVYDIIEQSDIFNGEKLIAIDFGPKPGSKLERYGFNRFENIDNLKHK